MTKDALTLDELRAQVGQELGVSDWIKVDQSMIDGFADVTRDHQFIHIDPVAAAKTPLGGTVAHGFLTLSLLPVLSADLGFMLKGLKMGMNYGFDRVRLMSPVRSGTNVRGRFTLAEVTDRGDGQIMCRLAASVEIENAEKPALVADWLILQFV